jgi:hypothetical protein
MRKFAAIALAAALLAGINLAYAGGEVVDLGGISVKVPDGWTKQKPTSKLRKYQFSLPKVDGDKEDGDLAVFQAIGGSVEANVERWKGQFLPPKGKSIDDVSKLDKFMLGKTTDVVVFDVSGTYLYRNPGDPNSQVERKENFRRINVLLDTDKGTYSITLTGPAKTIAKHKDSFDSWLKSFK